MATIQLGTWSGASVMRLFFKRCNALSLSNGAWTPTLLRHSPVDAREQAAKLRRRDRHGPVRHGLSQEAAAIEPLGVQARALAVVPDHRDQVALPAAEDEQVPGMAIALSVS